MNHKSTEYAEAKANRVYLEEYRKSLKAMLMAEAEQNGRKAGQERESYAYAHQDYLNLLDGLREAVKVEESLRWKLTSCKEKINYNNQQNMMRMAEMKLR